MGIHSTYNNIQYIMARNEDVLKKYMPYAAMINVRLKQEQTKTLAQLRAVRNQKKILKIESAVNGKSLFLDTAQIANCLTSKLSSLSTIDGQTAKQTLSQIYKNLKGTTESSASAIASLNHFIAASTGLLPPGSTITLDSQYLNEVESALQQSQNYSHGKLPELLGSLGEATGQGVAAATVSTLIEQLAKELNIDKGQIKATAQVLNRGNEQVDKATVQTDTQLTVQFSFGKQAIAKFTDLKNGLSTVINFSDKAKKNLSTLDSKRRSATGTIKFRESKVGTLLSERPVHKSIKDASYNIISYHRQGKQLTGLMTAAPGIALRKYLGYKLLQKMFLNSAELNQIHFTTYGTQVYAEQDIYDNLFKTENILADIEYWSLKSLIGKYHRDTIEKGLEEGTAEAHKRIDDMKVAIRGSLKLK